MVFEVQVRHEDIVKTASYFVEHGVIHARIGERVMRSPLLGGDANEMVRAMLLACLTRSDCMATHAPACGDDG
jgi:hypothetical protein